MKVIAINSSPMMDQGNTALILGPFIEGIREAGAKIELFHTKKLAIKPCQGCGNCWLKTPGRCSLDDDMSALLPRLADADLWILVSPVYVDGITGPMKNLMDRIIPLLMPFLELRDGHCRHLLRKGTKRGQVVLVSSCGGFEMDNFEPLLVHMKAFSKNVAREFKGSLLRPHALALKPMIKEGESLEDIFTAAKETGKQLVKNGQMPAEALRTIERNMMPRETYLRIVNQTFQQALDAL